MNNIFLQNFDIVFIFAFHLIMTQIQDSWFLIIRALCVKIQTESSSAGTKILTIAVVHFYSLE